MAVEARIGILKDRLVLEGVEYPIRREGGGWMSLPSATASPRGRVRYEACRDRIRIESPRATTVIPFRRKRTSFTYQGRQYRVGPMAWGHIMVSRDDRPVITGRVTLSGVRLGYVAPELAPIAGALAVGFAVRAFALWAAMGTAGASH